MQSIPFSITVPLNTAAYNATSTYYIGNLRTIPTTPSYSNATSYPQLANLSYTINLPNQKYLTTGTNSFLNGNLNTTNPNGTISLNFSFAQYYTLDIDCISILTTEQYSHVTPSMSMTMLNASNGPVYNPNEPGQTTNATIVVTGNTVANSTNFYYTDTYKQNGLDVYAYQNPNTTIPSENDVLYNISSYYITYSDQTSVPTTINMFTGVSSGSIRYGFTFTPSIYNYSNVYIANFQIFGTLNYTPPPPVVLSTALPISSICFVSNTPIETDQGTICISKIDPNIHTIQNNRIRAITRTIYEDDYLLCIHKNAFADKYPTNDIILSKEHKILIPPVFKMHKEIRRYFAAFSRPQFISSNKVAGIFETMPERLQYIRRVPYHGETLFNILLDKKGHVCVNNIICETLDPENIIAKLYFSNLGGEYKERIICMMNDFILKKDTYMYKRIASRLFMPLYEDVAKISQNEEIRHQPPMKKNAYVANEGDKDILYDPIHPILPRKSSSRKLSLLR